MLYRGAPRRNSKTSPGLKKMTALSRTKTAKFKHGPQLSRDLRETKTTPRIVAGVAWERK
jgi:hypothetical protein